MTSLLNFIRWLLDGFDKGNGDKTLVSRISISTARGPVSHLVRVLNPRRNPHRSRSKTVLGRSIAKTRCSQDGSAVRRVCRAHSCPAASLSHRFGSKTPSPARSPTDALIDLAVRCRLRRQVPICWFDLRPVIRLRIAVTPQRWPARRGYVWRLRACAQVHCKFRSHELK